MLTQAWVQNDPGMMIYRNTCLNCRDIKENNFRLVLHLSVLHLRIF